MELQQLRYVVAVAEEASFTRAAARCFVVQSALSHQIKALERELGVELFARTSRRVQITPAGEAFLAWARVSLAAAERAAADAAAAVGRVVGQLNVGVIPTVTAIDVPSALGAFREAHPQVGIVLRVAGSDELQEAIRRGELDVGLLGLPRNHRPSGVAWRHLGGDHLVAVVGHEHPLARRDALRLADLAGETFVDFPAGTPGRAQSDLAFSTAQIHREVAFEAMATDFMLGLVRQNLAVALLPARCAPSDSALASLPIQDGPVRDEYIAWSSFSPSPAARAFVDTIE